MARDSVYGLVWRVGVGALLSSVDVATDIYVVGTYYSEGLNGQASAMLGMISVNLFIQILIVLAVYQKKSLMVKLKEVLITGAHTGEMFHLGCQVSGNTSN